MKNIHVRYQVRDGHTIIEDTDNLTEARREYKIRLNQGYDKLMLVEIDERRSSGKINRILKQESYEQN
jgi:hypothetical protein